MARMVIDKKHREGAVIFLEVWASNPSMSDYDIAMSVDAWDVPRWANHVSGWSQDVARIALCEFGDYLLAAQRLIGGWTPRHGWNATGCRTCGRLHR
jgi:hypothetical protein